MNSKNKGNSFERDIARKLSLWLTDNKNDNCIWRSQTSGGRSTIRGRKGLNDSVTKKNVGDLIQTLDKGIYSNLDLFFNNFFVEIKKGYNDTFNFYPNFNKGLEKIIQQCIDNKNISNCSFFLIVKPDRKDILILTDKKLSIKYKLVLNILDIDIYCYLYKDVINVDFKNLTIL